MVALEALEVNSYGFVIGLMRWRLGFVRERTEGLEASPLLGVDSYLETPSFVPSFSRSTH